jgi:hypothetical protein
MEEDAAFEGSGNTVKRSPPSKKRKRSDVVFGDVNDRESAPPSKRFSPPLSSPTAVVAAADKAHLVYALDASTNSSSENASDVSTQPYEQSSRLIRHLDDESSSFSPPFATVNENNNENNNNNNDDASAPVTAPATTEMAMAVDMEIDEAAQWEQSINFGRINNLFRQMSADDTAMMNAPIFSINGGNASVIAASEHAVEICRACKKPLVFTANSEALICRTRGCTKHVYNICDNTVTSLAFGEEVDFVPSLSKPTNRAFKVADLIFGRKMRPVVFDEKIVVYMRICIQQSTGKTHASEITADDIQACAKTHGWWTAMTSHLTQLLCRTTGRRPPRVSEEVEARANLAYSQLRTVYAKHKPHNRSVFMNYFYVWYKIYERLDQHHVLPFVLMPDAKPLAKQDAIFAVMCKHLNWKFTPTVARTKPVIRPFTIPVDVVAPSPPVGDSSNGVGGGGTQDEVNTPAGANPLSILDLALTPAERESAMALAEQSWLSSSSLPLPVAAPAQ